MSGDELSKVSPNGIVYNTYTTTNGTIRMDISNVDGDGIQLEIDPETAHELAMNLVAKAWQATKTNMGTMGENFRRLGFFN